MINKYVTLEEIQYEDQEPSNSLMNSIRTRGIAIPVKVRVTEDGYLCVDGNKRLSACKRLSLEDKKFNRIPVMVLNDYSKAGSAYWGNTQNKH